MKFIFPSLPRRSIIIVSDNNLFTTYVFFITRHLTLTMRCHGNGKHHKAKTTSKTVDKINVALVGLIIRCKTTNIFAHSFAA